jgi:hypothetical protein
MSFSRGRSHREPEFLEAPNVNVFSAPLRIKPDGAKVPLGEVPRPRLTEGVARVYRK